MPTEPRSECIPDVITSPAIPSIIPGSWFFGGSRVDVSLNLAEGNLCVTRDFFTDYQADSLDQALDHMLRADIPLHYKVRNPDATRHLTWNVKWPLNRRGGNEGFHRRRLVQAASPLDWEIDNTLIELSKRYRDRVIMLTVGGRSKTDAGANWEIIATVVRSYIKKVKPS